jgi:hypothetical protein
LRIKQATCDLLTWLMNAWAAIRISPYSVIPELITIETIGEYSILNRLVRDCYLFGYALQRRVLDRRGGHENHDFCHVFQFFRHSIKPGAPTKQQKRVKIEPLLVMLIHDIGASIPIIRW